MTERDAPDFSERIKAHAAKPGKVGVKRFYKTVAVIDDPGGFGLALDGRPMRTPARAPLLLPNRRLAEAIAAEWAAQGNKVIPATMGLTRLANSAIDQVAGREVAVAAEIAAYAGSDLLCYRAEGPDRLAARQAAAWDPPLAWAARRLGSHFVCVTGLVHHPQSPAALDAFGRELARQGAFRLAALHTVTTLTASAILAFAVLEGELSADAAWNTAHIDEDWQIEQWGADAEAQARRAARRREFDCAVRLLELL